MQKLIRVCCWISLCYFLTAQLPAQEKNDVGKADSTAESDDSAKLVGDFPPSAKIDDVAWIAGRWRGEAMGGSFEETWNPPSGNSMIGMFKFIKDEKVQFYELLTIVEKDDSLLLRLKHFDEALVGWEDKDKSVEFPLVQLSDSQAIFDGLKFLKIDDSSMHILVRMRRAEKTEELKFVCIRARL